MSQPVVFSIAGVAFILVALIGGGITTPWGTLPPITKLLRMVFGLFGVAFLGVAIFASRTPDGDDSTRQIFPPKKQPITITIFDTFTMGKHEGTVETDTVKINQKTVATFTLSKNIQAEPQIVTLPNPGPYQFVVTAHRAHLTNSGEPRSKDPYHAETIVISDGQKFDISYDPKKAHIHFEPRP